MEKTVVRTTTLNRQLIFHYQTAIIWILMIVGLLLVVIRPMGFDLSNIPGDLGDARFNNYVLEHGFRYIKGLEESFWDAPIFYPYPRSITFSDNLLGSLPIYCLFRFIGFDRETAFQGWYILSFCINYIAAAYVLSKNKINPLAIGAGAFFFTFGLPLLNQVGHAQLCYRFAVPLACYSLYDFYQNPRLISLASLFFWLVWQFYLSIYVGAFLAICLVVMIFLLPLFLARSNESKLFSWPLRKFQAWKSSDAKKRIFVIISCSVILLSLVLLLQPYYKTSSTYGFSRTWEETVKMLPRWQSYFIADRLPFWDKISGHFSPNLAMRHEHQLFPGVAVIGLILIGVFFCPTTHQRRSAWLFLSLAVILVLLTLYFRRFTIYQALWWMPGFNSIRAVTRIMLVIMWPLSVFIAYALDAITILRRSSTYILRGITYFFVLLLIIEPILLRQPVFSKLDAQKRITQFLSQIPDSIPKNPILFLSYNEGQLWLHSEIDAMLLSQDLGWQTINGYSGNLPPGFKVSSDCSVASNQIRNYMSFADIADEKFYQEIMNRVVFVGFTECKILQ